MHVDPEPIADKAARITHATLSIQRKARRQRMDDLAICAQRLPPAGRKHPLDVIPLASWPPSSMSAENFLAAHAASAQIDDQRIHRHARHALARIHGKPDSLLGTIEFDHHAGLHAERLLWCPIPRMRTLMRAPGRCGLSSRGFSLAMIQQTLLEPTSSLQ